MLGFYCLSDKNVYWIGVSMKYMHVYVLSYFVFFSFFLSPPSSPFLCFSLPISLFPLFLLSLPGTLSYDFEKELDRELEGSDHFPVSCASSVTIVSEHDRHTFASPVTSGGESPVIRPHSFGFRSGSDVTHRGSHSEVEGSENHSHRLGSSSEGTNAKSLKNQTRSQGPSLLVHMLC